MKKILILTLIALTSCVKPPEDGCLDKAADNYNSKSDVNCCCVYSAEVQFKSDTLNTNDYIYSIDNDWVEINSKHKLGKLNSLLISYQIYNKIDSTLFIQSATKLYPGKTTYVKF